MSRGIKIFLDFNRRVHYALIMSELEFDITPYVRGWKKRMAEAQERMAARKRAAYADAQRIAQVLKEKYGCTRVVGIGSTFNEKDFTEYSDIDLVVYGLPEGKYFSISSEVGYLTSFEVDLIPAENARPLTLQLSEQEGVEL
jgi:predicted nucleotidyltransferase